MCFALGLGLFGSLSPCKPNFEVFGVGCSFSFRLPKRLLQAHLKKESLVWRAFWLGSSGLGFMGTWPGVSPSSKAALKSMEYVFSHAPGVLGWVEALHRGLNNW